MRIFYGFAALLTIALLLAIGSNVTAISNVEITNTPPSERQTWIAFASNRGGDLAIYVMAPDGSNAHRLTDINCDFPVWSPDGKKIAFISPQAGIEQIYVMNSDGTNQVNLSNNRAFERNPSWSPDGKYIFFASLASLADPQSYFQIYRMDSDGLNRVKISGDQLFESKSPAVSPDGKRIAFYSRDGDALYLMGIDGTNIVKLAVGKSDPVWSPDGKLIASKGGSSIYITNVENGNTSQLLADSAIGSTLSWSPDGKQLAFEAVLPNQNGRSQIYVINVDGSNRVNLSNNPFYDIHPAFSPVPVTINNFPIELTPESTRFIPESENKKPNTGTVNALDSTLYAQATEILRTVTAQAKFGNAQLRMTQTAFQATQAAKSTKP